MMSIFQRLLKFVSLRIIIIFGVAFLIKYWLHVPLDWIPVLIIAALGYFKRNQTVSQAFWMSVLVTAIYYALKALI